MLNFIAIVHQDKEEQGYGASFPDLPGCVTSGETLDELYDMAIEAVSFHLEGMLEAGFGVPVPMSLEDAMTHEFFRDAVSTFIVRVGRPDKQERVNIMIAESDLQIVDRAAEKSNESRSAFMTRASVDLARNLDKR